MRMRDFADRNRTEKQRMPFPSGGMGHNIQATRAQGYLQGKRRRLMKENLPSKTKNGGKSVLYIHQARSKHINLTLDTVSEIEA